MERVINGQLKQWKENRFRLPLLLEGARQTGKTWLLQHFGKEFPRCHHFDFAEDAGLKKLFGDDLRPDTIIKSLSIYRNVSIDPEKELVVFDEVQECPRALTSLKYFAENRPRAQVCASGSLLGVTLSDDLFPVGKVRRIRIHPMSFSEFLNGSGEERLGEFLDGLQTGEAIPESIHARLIEQLKVYFIVGGLPAAVNAWRENRDDPVKAFAAVRGIQNSLLRDYLDDIAKHSGKLKAVRISAMFKSVPSNLAREEGNARKFVFKDAVPGVSRYADLEGPIEWLNRCGLIHRIPIVSEGTSPLRAHVDPRRFKLYLFDVGLLGAMIQLSPTAVMQADYGTFKGWFAENFALQELVCAGLDPVAWHRNTAEVEFLLEDSAAVIPVEVKSGINTKSKSLQEFRKRYEPPFTVLLSLRHVNRTIDPRQRFLPLYLASGVLR